MDATVLCLDFSISETALLRNMERARNELLQVRSKRVRPLFDDKILASWNALMISAYARASRVFAEPHYEQLALQSADFVWNEFRDGEGRLLRRWREGEAAQRPTCWIMSSLPWPFWTFMKRATSPLGPYALWN